MSVQIKVKTKARGGLAAESQQMRAEGSEKPNTQRKPREKKERAESFVGISQYIGKKAVEEGLDNEAVFAAAQVEFPGCTKAWTFAVADKKRAKAAAAANKVDAKKADAVNGEQAKS